MTSETIRCGARCGIQILCVVPVTDATDRLPEGAMIEVDGDAGIVTLL